MSKAEARVTYLGKQMWPRRKANQYVRESWFALKVRQVKAWVRWFAIRFAIGTGALGLLFAGYSVRAFDNGRTMTVTNVIQAPQQKESMAAVMARIADCESGGGKKGGAKQFYASGEIVTNTNNNGSVDVGKYQINMSAGHLKEMAKLGFNPLTEEGNEAYAKWLYENRGTSDWSSSQHCWQ